MTNKRANHQNSKEAKMSKLWLALLIISLKTSYSVWACVVPPPSVECSSQGCKMYNYRGVWDELFDCTASAAYFPTSEAQVVDIVAMAVEKSRTVNVISYLVHSLTPLMCVGDSGVIVSTRDLSSYSYVDTESQTITVDAGMVIRDVYDEAAKHGLTLYDAPQWDGVTAAGVISTGSHGSSLRGKGSGVYEYVASLRLVVPSDSSEGYAKVLELRESDEEFKAAVLSLGTLGVITRVTFKLEPMFKRAVLFSTVSDDKLEDLFQDFMTNSDFPFILWNIGVGNASLQRTSKVSTNIFGNFAISTPGNSVNSTEQRARTYERLLMTGQVEKLCIISSGSNVTVGYNDKMATGGGCDDYHLLSDPNATCLPHKIMDKNENACDWDRRVLGLLIFDEEIRVPISRARDAILDLKKLRDLSPRGALCQFSNGGLAIRAIKKSEVYLGPPEDMVTFESFQYHDRKPFTPTTYMDVVQEMEQILIEKHGGHVHWGKSGGYLFQGQAQYKVANFDGFMRVKEKYDPKGVFSNPWTEGLLGIGGRRVEVVKKGCAIEKMCKCRGDEHCSPQDGYLCKPGRVWPQARVCRKV